MLWQIHSAPLFNYVHSIEYDFIMELPDGFDTVIGEGGASLSGGQAQRLSIARCILKDSPIVILDEATASVDADNESYIHLTLCMAKL